MPTSDERREVAERLRKLPSDAYAAAKVWQEDGLFIDANLSDEADYSQIHNAIFGCFPAEYMHPGDYEELHETLADLIDPTCEMVVKNGHACCGRCGHRLADECEVEEDYYEFRPFCPDCGARVTGGGDAE